MGPQAEEVPTARQEGEVLKVSVEEREKKSQRRNKASDGMKSRKRDKDG